MVIELQRGFDNSRRSSRSKRKDSRPILTPETVTIFKNEYVQSYSLPHDLKLARNEKLARIWQLIINWRIR